MDTPVRLLARLRAGPRRRDALDAAAVALVGIVLIALGIVDTSVSDGGPVPLPPALTDPWWHAAPLLVGCVVLLGKRHRPIGTVLLVLPLLAVDLALGGSIGLYVVLIDALYGLMLYVDQERVRPALVAVGIPIVLVPALAYVGSGDVRAATLLLLQMFALLGTPVWWGLSVRQQAQIAELASARADDLQRLSALQRDQAVRDERTRMAQDLHDALSSHLSTIAIHSEAALTGPAPPEGTTGRALAEIRTSSVRALEDLRQMILLLQTDADQITPAAGLADIGPLVASARSTGLSVDVEREPGAEPVLPSSVDHAAYRIVQESLANAARHAPGSQVRVTTAVRAGTLRLDIVSRGGNRPTGRSGGSGLGLRSMRDRAVALGGALDAGPREASSEPTWVVRARLPVDERGMP